MKFATGLCACCIVVLLSIFAFGGAEYPPIPTKPDSCVIIGEPQNRLVTLPENLGTAVISMVPVQLKSKTMGFAWMDGDGLVQSSESIQSATDKRRKERDEREKSAGNQDSGS